MMETLRNTQQEAITNQSLMRRVLEVIASCETADQLETAKRYADAAARRLNTGLFGHLGQIPDEAFRRALRDRAKLLIARTVLDAGQKLLKEALCAQQANKESGAGKKESGENEKRRGSCETMGSKPFEGSRTGEAPTARTCACKGGSHCTSK
jgi:hypothetical protein